MPDQRREGNKKVSAWLTAEELQQFLDLMEATGMTQSQLIKEAIDRMAEIRGVKDEDKRDN